SCTVQAPHAAMPQPNLVPVRPITSRRAHSRGMSEGTSTWRFLPLIMSSIGFSSLRLAPPISAGARARAFTCHPMPDVRGTVEQLDAAALAALERPHHLHVHRRAESGKDAVQGLPCGDHLQDSLGRG